jgi:hypothetical protein
MVRKRRTTTTMTTYSHDGFVFLESAGQFSSQFDVLLGKGMDFEILDVRQIVRDLSFLQPLSNAVQEELIGEVCCWILLVFNRKTNRREKRGSVCECVPLLQRVWKRLPILVSEALRLRRPTKPGHSPDQFAKVKIGPL